MKEKRRHKRYSLDLISINGKMSLTNKVEVLDISIGGVALKADRRLNIGKEYLITLQEKGKVLEVKGIVVRSELSGMEDSGQGERVSIYSAGLVFKDGYMDKVANFLKPIEHNKKKESPPVIESPAVPDVPIDRRLALRFNITTPGEEILSYPLQFKVRLISMGGMLIQTQQSVEIDCTIPMELSLDTDKAVKFIGKVVSCAMLEKAGQTYYDIGVEFTDLTDNDKMSLKSFVDYLDENEAKDK